MPARSKALAGALNDACAITRSLGVLRDQWQFLLIREALLGRRTFAEFRTSLGIATDVLSAHLAGLVAHGLMEKTPYQEAGQRMRHAYTLTPAGEELMLALAALQQWGDGHVPAAEDLTVVPVARSTRRRLRVAFVDEDGAVVEVRDAQFAPMASVTDP